MIVRARPRFPFAGLAFAAVLGVVAAEFWTISPWMLLPFLLGGAALLLCQVWTRGALPFVALSFFLLHTFGHRASPARHLAHQLREPRQISSVMGIVDGEPIKAPARGSVPRSRFPLRLETMTLSKASESIQARILVQWSGAAPVYGDRVSLRGDLRNLRARRNPGEFDYANHLQRKGIYSELQTRYPADCVIVSSGHGSPAVALAFRARRWMQERLAHDLEDSPGIAALIQSMVLGAKSDTPEEIHDLFQQTGTLHLFAVSGLNVAMLGGIVWVVLKTLRMRRKTAVFVIIPVLCFYALITGLGASSVRATIMGTLVLAAYLVDRQPLSYNHLAAAAFGILLWDTNQLFAVGFQFSFMLVLVIMSLGVRWQRWLERFGGPDPFLPRELWSTFDVRWFGAWRQIAAAVSVSLAAWCGSLLFTVGYFHLLSLSAIGANLVAVPLAFAILTIGVASLLVAGFSTLALEIFNNANWLTAKIILAVISFFARLPGGHIYVELPRFGNRPAAEVTVLDLGSGGGAHLRGKHSDWLIDCGSDKDYRRVVRPYLQSRGVNAMAGILLTHGDSSHIGAAQALLSDFAPRQIGDSPLRDRSPARRVLHAALAQAQYGKALYFAGDEIPLREALDLRVIHPPLGASRRIADDKALVVQLRSGTARVLFMSDSGFLTERWLLDQGADLRSDVLVKGLHASDLSGTFDFLSAVNPQVIICAAATFPDSAKIPEAWATEIKARGIPLFRQDETGAVTIELDGGEITVRSFLTDQCFRSRSR